ncbi:helix-turn-helix domain-containing protein [Geminicoccus sp.]|uniref:helix-turn-helix domain-containing protein n=1 Tax=Geminicoccus sp. TaxID=2024832 RepID=UPI0039C89A24
MTPLGKALRNLRMDREWLLKEMADGIGITPSFLSAVETGRKSPPMDLVDRIALWGKLDSKTRDKLFVALAETTNEVTLRLRKDASYANREAAAILARTFGDLTAEDIESIKRIVNRRRS